MTKNEIKVGMIIKHAYRKTLLFKVTEDGRTGKLLVKRVSKTRNGYVVQEGFKGYALSNRDYGLITIVDDGSGVPRKDIPNYKKMSKKELLEKIEAMANDDKAIEDLVDVLNDRIGVAG